MKLLATQSDSKIDKNVSQIYYKSQIRVVENYGAKIDAHLEKTSNWTISRKIIFLLTLSYPFKNRTILQKWRKIMDFRYNRTIRGGKILSSTITQQLLLRHKF